MPNLEQQKKDIKKLQDDIDGYASSTQESLLRLVDMQAELIDYLIKQKEE